MDKLLQPTPFPEEMDLGYLGRIRQINGYRYDHLLWRAIAVQVGSGKGATKHELLSKMAGQTSEQFARNHTSIPFRRAITQNYPHIAHGSLQMRTLLFGRTPHRGDLQVFFCEKCVKEDVDFHGVSYWRRDHQMPGQTWCPKHALPLHFARSKDSFGAFPKDRLGQSQMHDATFVSEARGNLFVQRYLELATAMYDRTAPLDSRSVGPILKGRAEKLGLVKTQRVRSKHPIDDRVQNVFPAHWLSVVLGGKMAPSGVPFHTTASVASHLLVIAVLFENADEAINALANAAVSGRHGPADLSDKVNPLSASAFSPP
ncbi:hypothetical protein PMI14_00681 [Acidovorax sp. CF316]|uniref:TniQ family protein n=1 Tax=Acidovorax sp. CF316 TaxID=1144317 RepID=UPI00026BD2D9|nr:TniQ family protein [Acidovorax sp. CF316]EJE54420.1 hypothetical protein PMI14_00681 [Acidovorax sp. CF316]